MEVGINAMNQRWYGSLVKRSFLHPPDKQDRFSEALAIQYLGVSFERANKVYHWSNHLHESIELLFVKEGSYAGALNGHEMELTSGEVLIIGPGDRHSDVCRPPLEYYALWYDIRQVTDGMQIHPLRSNLVPVRHVHALGDDLLLNRLDALLREEQLDNRFSLPLQQALAEEIFWRLLADLPEDILNPLLVKRTRESELLVQLTRLFESNLGTPMTVQDIAGALNMSVSALAHACTELLGVSPAKAWVRYRMAHAAQMLRGSNLTVKEIAAQLGFHDASHFIHTFRRERGSTPGAFRCGVV